MMRGRPPGRIGRTSRLFAVALAEAFGLADGLTGEVWFEQRARNDVELRHGRRRRGKVVAAFSTPRVRDAIDRVICLSDIATIASCSSLEPMASRNLG